MKQDKQLHETVNFRLYFKVIIRQNETQYFTYSIYTEQECLFDSIYKVFPSCKYSSAVLDNLLLLVMLHVLLLCIYAVCKVLMCFILSDDHFGIKSKVYSDFELQDRLILWILFLFIFSYVVGWP